MKNFRFPLRLLIIVFTALLLAAGSPAFGQTITLISPNTNGLVWSGANDITWSTSTSGWAPTDTVKIELSVDSGSTYDTRLATNLPYDLQEFRFYTGATSNDIHYRVKVSWTADSTIFDESAYDFTISNPATGTSYFVNDTDTSNDVYCSAPGNNINNGLTPASPKWNLQSIVDGYVLRAGDVVYVDTGRWDPSARVLIGPSDYGTAAGKLTFTGSPNGSVYSGQRLPAGYDVLFLDRSNYIEISRFSFQSAPRHGIASSSTSNLNLFGNSCRWNQQAGIYLNGGNATIENNTLANNFYGLFESSCQNLAVRLNTVSDNFYGISASYGLNTVIDHCLLQNNAAGIYVGVSINSLLVHNVFYGGSGIYLAPQTEGTRIQDNIIVPNGSGAWAFYYADPSPEIKRYQSDFNLISPIGGAVAGYWKGKSYVDFRAWVLNTSQDGHSISGDPLFADPDGMDYHLQSTEGRYLAGEWVIDSDSSPALNAGRTINISSPLAASVPAGAPTIPLVSSSGFTAGGDWLEIEGDFIAYTGISGNSLVGCGGVDFAHATGALAVQPAGADYSLEPDPNGYRANLGLFGNTSQASKSSLRSVSIDSPLGGPLGYEKWSGTHDILWRTYGTGWDSSDKITISLSTDSVTWSTITSDLDYDSSPFAYWDTASFSDSSTTRVQIAHSAGSFPHADDARTGILITDNTPPRNVGCFMPSDGTVGQPRLTNLIATTFSDVLSGLNASPYYFRIDTTPDFDSPSLLTSGWIPNNIWTISLPSDTTYYWQVKGRDNATPPNETAFQAQSSSPGSRFFFRTLGTFFAQTVERKDSESVTDGLRWILQNYDLGQGDIVYVTPGTYALSEPLLFSDGDGGSSIAPVRIVGYNGEVLLNGGGNALYCLRISGDYYQVENLSCTGAINSGFLVELGADHVSLQGGRSFNNGGDGIEILGSYCTVRNMLAYGNTRAGIHLSASHNSSLYNNTCSGNGTREVFLEDNPPNGSIAATLADNISLGPADWAKPPFSWNPKARPALAPITTTSTPPGPLPSAIGTPSRRQRSAAGPEPASRTGTA